MDFAYKIAVKRFFQYLIQTGEIIPQEVKTIHFFVDQHTTATSGIYELREGLEQELIRGTYNFEYQTFYPPLFPLANSVTLKYCDSKHVALIMASDIIASKIYRLAKKDALQYASHAHFYVIRQPN